MTEKKNKSIKTEILCLKCRQPFISPDKRTRRICNECNIINKKVRELNPTKVNNLND